MSLYDLRKVAVDVKNGIQGRIRQVNEFNGTRRKLGLHAKPE
jgi:hypothetical protein